MEETKEDCQSTVRLRAESNRLRLLAQASNVVSEAMLRLVVSWHCSLEIHPMKLMNRD